MHSPCRGQLTDGAHPARSAAIVTVYCVPALLPLYLAPRGCY